MKKTLPFAVLALVVLALLIACRPSGPAGTPGGETPAQGFAVEEATIAEIHRQMEAGRLTARQLVEHHLARIEACDKQGPRAGEKDPLWARSDFHPGLLGTER